MTTAQKIKAARLAAGHANRAAFARKVGIYPQALYRIEAGKFEPRAGTLNAIARVLKLQAADLIADTILNP